MLVARIRALNACTQRLMREAADRRLTLPMNIEACTAMAQHLG
jgi:hypothetical protein